MTARAPSLSWPDNRLLAAPDVEAWRDDVWVRLKAVYVARGYRSRAAWARALGIERYTTWSWLKRYAVPDTPCLVKLAEVDGVDLTWLLTGQGSMFGT